MGQSLSNTLNRIIQKATYSPDVDKAIDQENAAIRDKRELFKNKISRMKDNIASRNGKIATVVNEKYKKRIKDAEYWLDSNRNAASVDIDNQSLLFTNDCATIEATNEGNLFYERVLALADLQAAVNNKITYTVTNERSWYNNNLNLPLNEYKNRKTNVFDPALIAATGTDIDISNIESVNMSKQVEELKKKQNQFKVQPSVWETILTTFFSALWSLLYIAIILAGGSLAANLMVHRPVPYRFLAFIYGCLGSPLLIIYSIFRLIKADPILIYAMFIPIFKGPSTDYMTFFSYYEDDKLKERKATYIADGLAFIKASSAIAAATNTAISNKPVAINPPTNGAISNTRSNTNAFTNDPGSFVGFGNENTNNSDNPTKAMNTSKPSILSNANTLTTQTTAPTPLTETTAPTPLTETTSPISPAPPNVSTPVEPIPVTQDTINRLHDNLDKNVAARKEAEELAKLTQEQSRNKALEERRLQKLKSETLAKQVPAQAQVVAQVTPAQVTPAQVTAQVTAN